MKPKTETTSASAHPELAREQGEAPPVIQGGVTAAYGRRFGVILIQEGLGNFGDASYYTREALESAAPLYEGRKFMVDHPSATEEKDRPERSVRDIAGHYENVRVEIAEGRAVLAADLIVLPGPEFDWVRTLLKESLEYSKRHEGDLVGLSINANGDAAETDLEEFIASGRAPAAAVAKLKEAQSLGITTINVVNRITSATSCDLVTEAGAGGKPVSLIEQEKSRMKVKSKEAKDAAKDPKATKPVSIKESDAAEAKDGEKPAAAGTDGAGDAEQHDDEEKDKALIADMMKKFAKAATGDTDGEADPAAEAGDADEKDPADKDAKDGADKKAPAKEAEEAAHSEADMAAAHEAFKHAKKAFGCENEEAAKIACAAVHAAKHMAASKEAADAMESEESKEESQPDPSKLNPGKKESAKAPLKESDRVLSLTAENSRLKESLRKVEIEKHLDKALRESGLPMSVTKKFRECIGTPKSVSDIDDKLKIFQEAYQVGGEADGMGFVINAEKQETEHASGFSAADCVVE